jgi:hypothetical protein
MGLKGYRLWVMGQLDSNVQIPTAVRVFEHRVQVAQQRQAQRSGTSCI